MVYPNPATNQAQIVLSSNRASDVQVSVFNTMGQLVNTFNQSVVAGGVQNITLNLENLQTGVYFVSVQAEDVTLSTKLIVQ